jgi:hypothetical protein
MAARSRVRSKKRNIQTTRKRAKPDLDTSAGYLADGTGLASLRQVADPAVPTRNAIELSQHERSVLVAKRLEAAPEDFQIAMFGVGIVDKNRAIQEVRARSKIGLLIIEIELRVIESEATAAQSLAAGEI